jgi:hypothetical protein
MTKRQLVGILVTVFLVTTMLVYSLKARRPSRR